MSKSLDDSEFKILSSGPSPQIPPPKTLLMHFKRIILNIAINIVVIIGSPYLVYVFSRKWDIVNAVINKAKASSIKQSQEYKNKLLIDRIWSQPIGKLYFDAVEYQRMEGWCCSTTVRSILKSIPAIKTQDIPEAKSGPATVAEFATKIDGDGRDKWIKSNVVLGSEGYDTFVQCLKEKVNDTRFRVAVNFLRSPLFGFKSPWWFPMNAVLGFFGGHFSPVVGYLEDRNLVAVFDVNHEYSIYLVDARRLFDAIATHDVMSGSSRGYVVTEIIQ